MVGEEIDRDGRTLGFGGGEGSGGTLQPAGMNNGRPASLLANKKTAHEAWTPTIKCARARVFATHVRFTIYNILIQ